MRRGLFALCAALSVTSPTSMGQSNHRGEGEGQVDDSPRGQLSGQIGDKRAPVAAAKQRTARDGKSVDLRDNSFPSIGDTNAPVVIVEFSDFECPYCRQHQQQTMPQLMRQYVASGKVRYYVLDFPLSFHPQAERAAIAAACARQGGDFWKMHGKLFAAELDPSLYSRLAADIGLDPAAFNACVNDPKVKKGVRRAASLGRKGGVQGTPSFVIGTMQDGVLIRGQLLGGARPFDEFKQIIEGFLPL